MEQPIRVHTTTASEENARRIARALITDRLAACVQIHPVESFYRWDGMVENDAEFALECKTLRSRYDAVAECIRRHHDYELPAIEFTAIAGGSDAYLAWIGESVSGSRSSSGSPSGP